MGAIFFFPQHNQHSIQKFLSADSHKAIVSMTCWSQFTVYLCYLYSFDGRSGLPSWLRVATNLAIPSTGAILDTSTVANDHRAPVHPTTKKLRGIRKAAVCHLDRSWPQERQTFGNPREVDRLLSHVPTTPLTYYTVDPSVMALTHRSRRWSVSLLVYHISYCCDSSSHYYISLPRQFVSIK